MAQQRDAPANMLRGYVRGGGRGGKWDGRKVNDGKTMAANEQGDGSQRRGAVKGG